MELWKEVFPVNLKLLYQHESWVCIQKIHHCCLRLKLLLFPSVKEKKGKKEKEEEKKPLLRQERRQRCARCCLRNNPNIFMFNNLLNEIKTLPKLN